MIKSVIGLAMAAASTLPLAANVTTYYSTLYGNKVDTVIGEQLANETNEEIMKSNAGNKMATLTYSYQIYRGNKQSVVYTSKQPLYTLMYRIDIKLETGVKYKNGLWKMFTEYGDPNVEYCSATFDLTGVGTDFKIYNKQEKTYNGYITRFSSFPTKMDYTMEYNTKRLYPYATFINDESDYKKPDETFVAQHMPEKCNISTTGLSDYALKDSKKKEIGRQLSIHYTFLKNLSGFTDTISIGGSITFTTTANFSVKTYSASTTCIARGGKWGESEATANSKGSAKTIKITNTEK